jgi:acyl carrier protein
VKASEDGLVTKDVPGEVRRLIHKWIDVTEDRLTLDASLIDLGADSLAMVDLLLDFEEEFWIDIPDDEAPKIRTVGEAIDAVEKLVRARASA